MKVLGAREAAGVVTDGVIATVSSSSASFGPGHPKAVAVAPGPATSRVRGAREAGRAVVDGATATVSSLSASSGLGDPKAVMKQGPATP